MSDARLRWIVAFAVFATAAVFYTVTLTPTVGLVDSGALTVAAWSLGNAHPPGFPLYLVLTHLATLVPVGPVAVRANAASAFFAALACAAVALIAAEVAIHQKAQKTALVLSMVFAGLLTAFSRTLWGYATVAEVYALNTFLLAAIVVLLLAWRRTDSSRLLYAAAVVFGLALGVHHVSIGLSLAGIAAFVLATAGLRLLASRQFVVAAAASVAAVVVVYSYLPIAASREPVLNWGNPDTPSRIAAHVTAKQYRSYISTTSKSDQWNAMKGYVSREFGPVWFPAALLLAIYGLAVAFRRDRPLFWLLIFITVATGAWSLVYPIVNDRDAYLLPAFVAITLFATFGFLAVARRSRAIAAALLLLPLVASVVNWKERDRSEFRVARLYAENALRGIEPGSILFTSDWQLWAPLFYLREAEGLRRDVVPIEYGMLIRSWYLQQLEQQHPELFEPVRDQLVAYRTLLEATERDPERAANPVVQQTMNARLDDLVLAMIDAYVQRGGHAHASVDVAMSDEAVDQNLIRRIAATYDSIPTGVTVEFVPRASARVVTPTPIDLDGVEPPTAYAPDDVVVREVRPAYAKAFLVRARYLAGNGKQVEALAEYVAAQRLNPGDPSIAGEIERLRQSAR